MVVYSLTKYIAGHGTVVGGALVDGGNFDWTADPKRQPLFNEPDESYGGVVWGKAVPELTGANVAFAGSIVDSGNFDWTADPKRQPLFNEPDASYGGVVWGKAVPELTCLLYTSDAADE